MKSERIGIMSTVNAKYIKYPSIMQDGDKTAEFGLEVTRTIETDDGKFVIPKGGKTVQPQWGLTKEQLIASLTKQKTDAATEAQSASDNKQSEIDAVTAI